MLNASRTACASMVSACLLVTGAECASGPASPSTDRTVQTRSGAVTGHVRGTAVAFLGIPYAQPPVGPLRWRPPVPHAPWTGTLDADRFGSVCPQPVTAPGGPASSEDCLFLNVYAPNPAGAGRRPVMVWVHGGTNTTGAGSFYDPTPLLEAGDVVVVTLNYRLGALGFLAHPAFQAEAGTTGSYGLADQQLALRWVKANIAGFGGDPANVTLFGESSGGLNVLSQLASPAAAGLFDKAIVESGTFLLDTPTLAESEAQGSAFAAQVGCTDQPAACLRAKSVADVLAHQGSPYEATSAYDLATVDGLILPTSQRDAFAEGRFRRVPVMLGNNGQEGRLFVPSTLPAADYGSTLEGYARAAHRPVPGVLETYPLAGYATPADGASAAFGDSTFACTDRVAQGLIGRFVPTYAYAFDDTAGGTAPDGATHGSELRYLFGVTGMGPVLDGDPAGLPGPSRALSWTMRRYWTGFARSGIPGRPDLPGWPAVTRDAIQSLVAPTPRTEPAGGFDGEHKCSYWNGTGDRTREDPRPAEARRADFGRDHHAKRLFAAPHMP